jgi:hypothetical protein
MEKMNSAVDAAAILKGTRYVDAEFMYRPRPTGERERFVFDYTLQSRLRQLEAQDAVLFICESGRTVESLEFFQTQFPHLKMVSVIVNPGFWSGEAGDTPQKLEWDAPNNWQRYATTDRWARIDFALEVGRLLNTAGYLLMPAHDAIWGKGLLEYLQQTSDIYRQNGLPAAVSPYTYYQHSPIPGANIPQDIINVMNTAFGRDMLFPWKIRADQVQAFWGKMSMTPFGMCNAIRQKVDQQVWEDDLEIDGAIRRLGYGVRCRWISDAKLYRQAPPVFDHTGLQKVIERTLHYSLNIPGTGSALNFPLKNAGHVWRWLNPKFARNNAAAEQVIAEINATIQARLKTYGASWVDWGAYRYVMRVGDPAVEVWKRGIILV